VKEGLGSGPLGPLTPGLPIDLTVPRAASGTRLDRFIARALGVSRSELQRWIDRGHVEVDGQVRQPSATLRGGERIVVQPERPAATAEEPDAEVRFEVLHVDEHVVVLSKPAGLVVHPARGHEGGTLVNGLLALGLFRREDLLDEASSESHSRPGIVHRLDKGTSGVMVVARTAEAREKLKAQFQAHSIRRAYEAIVVGEAEARTLSTLHGRHPRDRLRFTTHVHRGKRAITHVRPLARLRGATHVECTLETGRTHQIRVHLAESGTPVLGDPLYGQPPRDRFVCELGERLGHQALHARLLGFVHPHTGAHVAFEAAAPEDFLSALEALKGRRD
jgi:23S rRNA pseudouridine1911/1915/1917 synthase